MSKLIPVFLLLFLVLPPGVSHGFETKGQDCSKCHALGKDEAANLLKPVFPDIKVDQVTISPSRALWEVFAESGGKKGIIYVDLSKKYLIMGSLISIAEKKNLTQDRLTYLNRVDLSQIPLDDALVMGDPKAKIRIVAFDDPD